MRVIPTDKMLMARNCCIVTLSLSNFSCLIVFHRHISPKLLIAAFSSACLCLSKESTFYFDRPRKRSERDLFGCNPLSLLIYILFLMPLKNFLDVNLI